MGRAVADPTADFFQDLAAAEYVPTFEGASASIRFDVAGPDGGTQHWHVAISDGDVAVTRRLLRADAVVRIGSRDMAAMVTGRLNAQAAIIRGLLTCRGSMAAFIAFQRCLPSPPGSTGSVAPMSSHDVMAARGLT